MRSICVADLQVIEELQVQSREQSEELERRARAVSAIAENVRQH